MNIHISYRVRGPSIIPAVLALVLSAGCSGDRPEFGPIQAPESDAGASGEGTSSTSDALGEGGATDDSSPSDTTTTSSTGEGSGEDGSDGETTSNSGDVDDTSDSDTSESDTKEPSGASDTDSDTAETDTDTDTEEQDASTAPEGEDDTSSYDCEPDTTRSCAEDGEQGTCGTGIQTCGEDGIWGDCSIVPAGEDTCEPGNDDNCDGTPNEGCPCVDGETQDCGHATVGVCTTGTSTCKDKAWGTCMGNIEPQPRDCSSSDDNDCDGNPDNTVDDVCKCAVDETQSCNERPGFDANPPCQAGTQSCVLSTNKTSSDWGPCTGDVGPAASDTCEPGNDDNCNGSENDGCDCVNGMQMSCPCGDPVICISGTMPSCGQSQVLRYRDADNDGFGNPNNSSDVCPGELGWVASSDDCDDNDPDIYPNALAICASDEVTRQSCPASGGDMQNQSCKDGCHDGACRTDGTIGVPGIVSCDGGVTRCAASVGCHIQEGTCGDDGGNYTVHCDAPSDCASDEKCWHFSFSGIHETVCAASQPSSSYREVCDPLDYTCSSCTDRVGVIYRCPLAG